MLNGDTGTYLFCRDCEQYETCGHNYRKILQCNKTVIEYSYEIERGFNMYPVDGNYEKQPIWFMDLLRLCEQYKAEIRKSNVQR